MKTILLFILTISALFADMAQSTTEIQLDGWYAKDTGSFQNNGSVINLNERGFDSKIAPYISVDFNGKGKYKNFKLDYTHIKQDSKKVLTADMQQNGVNFDRDEITKSTLDLDIVDAIYYIDAGKVKQTEIKVGVGLRYVDGSYQTQICSKRAKTNFDMVTPIGYVELNMTPTWLPAVWTNELILSPTNDEHIDVRTALKKEIHKNINAEIGYRANEYDRKDGYKAYIISKGFYFGMSYKF